MNGEIGTTMRGAIDRGRPLLDALIAELSSEAQSVKERDLDPRNLADARPVQEAHDIALDAIDRLTQLGHALDQLIKSRTEQLHAEERAKGLSNAPVIQVFSHHEPSRAVNPTRLAPVAKAHEVAGNGANKSKEIISAAGWAAAAGAVIYAMLMDEKRRNTTKRVAKASGSYALSTANGIRKATMQNRSSSEPAV